MSEGQPAYQVLARKYRPETFADLVGQEVMVQTLRNAFQSDRIAQAFVMTGIRGTGKTTTARIIAKGLNCVGPDGQGGPTTEPCGVCEHCTAIMEGRHVDVLEMDAASRTGVNDIREIIDSVHYRAASARYKIYVIDEVHMLSTSAFNALLKTLEEPPAHVKFIFATTEIRKVPVTVLSRCQRFDLRRIEPEVMIALLRKIAQAEGAEIEDSALGLITRAAEGSARDATSLLDQAISHGTGKTDADQVRAMLGLADRGRVLDLFEMILRGDSAGALQELGAQYADGADPVAVMRDLAEITHWVSVVKITPDAAQDPTLPAQERLRGQDLSQKIAMRILTRMWQMLLKALEEVSAAPNAMMAAEMAVIRLTHVADLPSPEDLVRKLKETQTSGAPRVAPQNAAGTPRLEGHVPSGPIMASHVQGGAATSLEVTPQNDYAAYPNFEAVCARIRESRDAKLLFEVETYLRLADYKPGRISFAPTQDAPTDFTPRLAEALRRLTGMRWAMIVVNDDAAPTIAEARRTSQEHALQSVLAHPFVEAALAQFPGARVVQVATRQQEQASEAQLEEIEEPDLDPDWDPFEQQDDEDIRCLRD